MNISRVTRFATYLNLSILTAVAAQEIPVPLHVQAQFFKKIFAYSQTIANANNPSVAIIAPTKDEGSGIQAAFNKVGLVDSEIYTPDEFASATKKYDVAYICADTRIDNIAKLCVSHKILSVTGSSGLYDSGKIGIGLKLHENKCQILLNMDRVKKEDQRFSAAFLNLTKSK